MRRNVGFRRTLATVTLAAATLGMGVVSTYASAAPKAHAASGGGTATMALDETLAGLNVNTSASNEFVLQEIMNLVWPTVYITTGGLKEILNTTFVTSVKETNNPQRITYTINPKAVWQDGTPITADDFIYNWQTQSGLAKYTDVGHKAFQPAGTTGYNQIATVVGSKPASGAACAAGSAKDYNAGLCPNGSTVTVTFSKPFADWQSLFGNIVPAHVGRVVGWNTGFKGATQTISGSWYEIKSVSDSSVVLVRNPKFWATPGKLSSIVFQQFGDDTQEVPALANSEVQVINPLTVDLSIVQAANQVPGIVAKTVPGLEFEHFDFNQSDPYLAKLAVRQAIAYGTNRKEIISHTVGEIDSSIQPLGNRMYMNSQPQYVNNAPQYDTVNVAMAKSLLKGLGFTMGSDGYFHPNYGPLKGKDLTFVINSTTGNASRAATEQIFQANMKAVGIKIEIQNFAAGTLFPNIAKGDYQITEFAWVATPFVSANESIYCSYNLATCGQNWTHFTNAAVDKLVFAGAGASSNAAETQDFNAADKILWAQMDTLPLYQKPQFDAWSTSIHNVIPNASSSGITWNGQVWSRS